MTRNRDPHALAAIVAAYAHLGVARPDLAAEARELTDDGPEVVNPATTGDARGE